MPDVQQVGPPSSRWNFHSWSRCDDPGEARTFGDRSAAAHWLRQFRSDPIAMAELRALAATIHDAGPDLWRARDEQVLESVAWLLARGVLHVHRVPATATAWRPATANVVASTATAPRSRPTSAPNATNSPAQPSAPVKQADEPDTFSARTDAEATAQVLREAAIAGVPFCEECAKAAAGAARQAA